MPGCGKSTLSHILANKFRNSGFDVVEPTYESDNNTNKFLRLLYKIYKTLCYLYTNTIDYYKLKKLVKDNKYTDWPSILRQIINIIPKLVAYNQKRNRIYIWDEGLVQSSISLAMINDCNVQDNFKQLFDLTIKPKVIKVYLKTDVETSLFRMNNRTSNLSRVEKEKEPIRKIRLLIRFEECCKEFEKNDRMVFDSDMKNIDVIYKELLEMLSKLK